MGIHPQLRTERLLLRRWRASDREPFAAINGDAAVMELLAGPLTRARSDALIERFEAGFRARGYGLWAVELAGESALAGYVGLCPVELDVAFAPAVELGWRLARECWGRGIATEAASASVTFAFEQLCLPGLVAYTAAVNGRSRRVMERLGMTHSPAEDFAHPRIAPASPLSQHVLCRLDAASWGSAAPERLNRAKPQTELRSTP